MAMCLDHCPPLPASKEAIAEAVERTIAWAGRCKAAHTRADQALFGIVQGGPHADLRAECAEALVALDFDGYAIGGVSVGEGPRAGPPGPRGDDPPPARRPAALLDGRRPARKTSSTPSPPGSTCSTA